DNFGFTALPGSARYGDGVFSLPYSQGLFWSSTDTLSGMPSVYLMNYDDAMVGYIALTVNNGLSVRCIMDTATACSPLPDAANAGPDNFDIPGLSTNLQGNQAATGSGVWRILSGTGGSLADSTLATTVFTGQAYEYYELSWTISNACGYSTDKVILSFLPPPPLICGDTLVDTRDSQAYPTVQIGTQCWMAKNLNVGNFVYSNADWYAHSDMYNNQVIEKYCQNNNDSNCLIYGGLYEWNEAMGYDTTPGTQGICPDGWHIPTAEEWDLLSLFLGGDWVAGGLMKDTGTALWTPPNQDATNSSGFTAIPGGNRDPSGSYGNLGNNTTWWVSKQFDPNNSWYRDIGYVAGNLVNSYHLKEFGFSVRCLSNTTGPCAPQPDQANAGPDTFNIYGTSISLQANAPSSGNGQWTILSGQGGGFIDDSHPNTTFSGNSGEAYVLVWTVSTACGSSTDTLNLSFAAPAFNCGDTLTDARDGQQYPTVQIGTQCWMAKNLNIGVMVYDDPSYGILHSHCSDDGIIEKYCSGNDPNNCLVYGGLYEWNEMMNYSTIQGVQGICPVGWHIPSDGEWSQLVIFLGGGSVAGGMLKDNTSALWMSPNSGATNSSGFSALPGGIRYSSEGTFPGVGANSYFWTSTITAYDTAWYRRLRHDYVDVIRSANGLMNGHSVRCLKD
ncbi:MAG: hypothetical protein IH599_00425, partial [Bacteroidales bacterium]|nr:hypothetical protein [Bacteroidales bacterium]